MWNLSINSYNKVVVNKEKGIPLLVKMMRKHTRNTRLLTKIASVLWELTFKNDENKSAIQKENGIPFYVKLLRRENIETKLLINLCGGLNNLLHLQAISMEFKKEGGIDTLVDLIQNFFHSDDVLKALCEVLV